MCEKRVIIGPFIINRRQGECHLLESLLENPFNSATVLITGVPVALV
jgi:hypothetical protein